MTSPSSRFVLLLAAVLVCASGAALAVGFDDTELDTRFSAKVAKERAKHASKQSQLARDGQNNENGPSVDGDCGSQNIGNVDLGGRPGNAPREIFVFAPNAVNIVTARGCR